MGDTIDIDPLLCHTEWIRALALDVLRDPDRAEDVVQQTWLAAIQHLDGAERDGPRLRAWLARVARNFAALAARGDGRRRRREEQSARQEQTPSTSEALERIALQQEVAAAVLALDPRDRDVISLRYYDGLPPREIARRLGLTPNAVSVRLSRAKAALRAQLESKHEHGRPHWAVVVVGWSVRRGARDWVTPAALTGGLAVKTIVMVSACVLVALLLGLGAYRLFPLEPAADTVAAGRPDESVGPRRNALVEAPEPAREPLADSARTPLAATLPEAEELPPVTAERSGSVLVRVETAGDGAPAEAIGLELHAWDSSDDWFHARTLLTDERGEALFSKVPLGSATVYIKRLSEQSTFGAETVEVAAGATAEVEFEVVAGMTVHTRVVDYAGRAVPGAEIWLGEGTGMPHFGQVIGRSGADGTFVVRHVSSFQALAARAPGYAPSLAIVPLFRQEPGSDAAEVEIELLLPAAGGALQGQVQDAAGLPVADAVVLIGNAELGNVHELEGKPAYDAPLVRLRTGADGRFRAEGVAAELIRVRARGLGTAVAETTTLVPVSGTAQVVLTLEPAANLVGTLRHASGRAVIGAEVGLEDDVDDLHRSRATVEEDGSFVLRGVPVGLVTVLANLDDEGLSVQAELETRSGETVTWDPVFPSTAELSGRLVDEGGEPLGGWMIRRRTNDPGVADEMARGQTDTDADGRFRFEACPLAVHTLEAFPPGQWFLDPAASALDVTPGGDEVLLLVPQASVPTARLRGRVVDSAGDGIAGVQLSLSGDALYARFKTDDQGEFLADYLPATTFELSASAAGYLGASVSSAEPVTEGEDRRLAPIVLEHDDG